MPNVNKQQQLKGKLALITGASRGIGAAVAEAYAQQGANLILVARHIEGLEQIDDRVQAFGVNTTLVPLDLKSSDKIDELALQITQRFGKLDIIVGNAGVLGTLSPISHLEPEVWDEVMAVNLTANMRLIRAFDPLLRQAPHGRAIFVTSGITHHIKAYWSAYSSSKVALERLVKIYAAEVANIAPNLKVNLLDPGVVRTALRRQAMPGEDPQSIATPEDIVDVFVKLASEEYQGHGEVVLASKKAV